eukprot:22707-Eustigmatos_ZCMA.PRE.1
MHHASRACGVSDTSHVCVANHISSLSGAVAIKLSLQDQVDGKLGLRGAVLICPMVRVRKRAWICRAHKP